MWGERSAEGIQVSRFDVDPAHPNAPGPNKKPLNNMCPTVVTRKGQPILALGGRGGRRIQNAVYEVLVQYVALGRPLGKLSKEPVNPRLQQAAALGKPKRSVAELLAVLRDADDWDRIAESPEEQAKSGARDKGEQDEPPPELPVEDVDRGHHVSY